MNAIAIPLIVAALALGTDARGAPGISASLRAGYGIPAGMISNDNGGEMSSLYTGAVPLWLDAGWRFDDRLLTSAYFQWGFGLLGAEARTVFAEAGGSDLRAGLEATYSLAPQLVLAPWVGIGLGYEQANFWGKTTVIFGNTIDVSTQIRGFDLMLQAGADWRGWEQTTVGPFVSVTVGQFQSMQGSGGGVTTTRDFPNKAWHAWFQLGLRGTYEVPLLERR